MCLLLWDFVGCVFAVCLVIGVASPDTLRMIRNALPCKLEAVILPCESKAQQWFLAFLRLSRVDFVA